MPVNARCPKCGCFMSYYIAPIDGNFREGYICHCGYDTNRF